MNVVTEKKCLIPVLRRQSRWSLEFVDSLVYIASSRPARTTQGDPVSVNK